VLTQVLKQVLKQVLTQVRAALLQRPKSPVRVP
jgi:hypothetical protein